jgi:hypothetical protein
VSAGRTGRSRRADLARPLILTWGALMALFDLAALLPGNIPAGVDLEE